MTSLTHAIPRPRADAMIAPIATSSCCQAGLIEVATSADDFTEPVATKDQHYCTIKISASNNMQQIGHSIKLKPESI
jgi:hypothetical protein